VWHDKEKFVWYQDSICHALTACALVKKLSASVYVNPMKCYLAISQLLRLNCETLSFFLGWAKEFVLDINCRIFVACLLWTSQSLCVSKFYHRRKIVSCLFGRSCFLYCKFKWSFVNAISFKRKIWTIYWQNSKF